MLVFLNWETLDDMGSRIDDLEKNICDLMSHAGLETPDKWYLQYYRVTRNE